MKEHNGMANSDLTHGESAQGIRVMLVDDSPIVLKELCHFLAPYRRIEIVGTAQDAETAMSVLPSVDPDLVVIDITMPGMDGIQATRRIKQLDNPPGVIILSLEMGTEWKNAAYSAGADGFCDKIETGSQLVPLIEEVFDAKHDSPPAPSQD